VAPAAGATAPRSWHPSTTDVRPGCPGPGAAPKRCSSPSSVRSFCPTARRRGLAPRSSSVSMSTGAGAVHGGGRRRPRALAGTRRDRAGCLRFGADLDHRGDPTPSAIGFVCSSAHSSRATAHGTHGEPVYRAVQVLRSARQSLASQGTSRSEGVGRRLRTGANRCERGMGAGWNRVHRSQSTREEGRRDRRCSTQPRRARPRSRAVQNPHPAWRGRQRASSLSRSRRECLAPRPEGSASAVGGHGGH